MYCFTPYTVMKREWKARSLFEIIQSAQQCSTLQKSMEIPDNISSLHAKDGHSVQDPLVTIPGTVAESMKHGPQVPGRVKPVVYNKN